MRINQKTLLKKGYKWNFDCCRITMHDILRQPDVKAGFCINGGFFNLFDNFTPVGFFKTDDFVSDYEPPAESKEDYGSVIITQEGLMKISDKYGDRHSNSEQVISTGPVLIKNNQYVFTDEKCKEKGTNNLFKFDCVQPPFNNLKAGSINGYKTCTTIPPGTFYHACQKNPRTLLAEDKYSNIYYIYIEGRNQRGPGLSLQDVARVTKGDFKTMINLDGGGSSQMVWKTTDSNAINQTNPARQWSEYPVGSTISLIKK